MVRDGERLWPLRKRAMCRSRRHTMEKNWPPLKESPTNKMRLPLSRSSMNVALNLQFEHGNTVLTVFSQEQYV